MESELINEQIARVFAMYLGCQCRNGGTVTYSLITYCLAAPFGFANTQMALTPLSKISDEDAEVIAFMTDNYYEGYDLEAFKQHAIIRGNAGHHYDTYQYLIQRGYAVRLFIEPDHVLNGKTAIEIGIAIDKTL